MNYSQEQAKKLDSLGFKWMVVGKTVLRKDDDDFPSNITHWLKSAGKVRQTYDMELEEWVLEPKAASKNLWVFDDDWFEWQQLGEIADEGTYEVYRIISDDEIKNIIDTNVNVK